MLRGIRAGFANVHILSRWNPPFGAVEMAIVTRRTLKNTQACAAVQLQSEVHVLFHCQDLSVCSAGLGSLREKHLFQVALT